MKVHGKRSEFHGKVQYKKRIAFFGVGGSGGTISSRFRSIMTKREEKKRGFGDSEHLLHGGKDPPEEATYTYWKQFHHVAVLSSIQAEGDRG